MAASGTRVETRTDSAGRRKFTVGEKRQIVDEYTGATDQTGRGEVLRRWGTYQQNVSRWRREIEAGTLGTKRKGPDPIPQEKLRQDLRRSEAKLKKAREEIATLKALIQAQGKALGLHAETVGSPVSDQD